MPEITDFSDPSEWETASFSDIEEAFSVVADSFRPYECLQSFLSPLHTMTCVEEFHIEADELRGLVTVLNGDMDYRLVQLKEAIRKVPARMEARP